jgi:hypothetical protein
MALARKVARRVVHFLVPGTLLIVSAAPLILIPFGEDYVREGTPVLRVLACACVFQATIALYISVAGLPGLGLRILAVNGALTLLLIVERSSWPLHWAWSAPRWPGSARAQLSRCRFCRRSSVSVARRVKTRSRGANGLPVSRGGNDSLNMQEGSRQQQSDKPKRNEIVLGNTERSQ